jgi:hypothetical protein
MNNVNRDNPTPSQENGTLLHAWQENPSAFIVSELNKPAEKLADLTELFDRVYIKEGYKTDSIFSSYCSRDYSIGMDELSKYKDYFIAVHNRVATDDEIKLLIYAFRFCRETVQFGGTPGKKGAWAELTVLDKFQIEALPYLRFLKEANGKVILTKDEKNTLENCQQSIRNHPFAADLLFNKTGQNEVELFWEKEVEAINVKAGVPDKVKIKKKGKLDKIIIDEFNRIIIIIDTKTISKPISTFTDINGPYRKYNYGRQLNNYAEGWIRTNLSSSSMWTAILYNVVVQSNELYPTAVFKTSFDVSSMDNIERRLAFHIINENWDLTLEEQLNGGFIQIAS